MSFNLNIVFMNPGNNYLSAGEQPLPAMYGVLTVLFAAAAGLWLWQLRQNREKIHTIHHLFTVQAVTKVLAVMVEGIMYAGIAALGHPTGWAVLFYILTFVKGMVFFVGILLIGTGWSLLRPFLSSREKRLLLVVLPIQVLNNIAIIVVDEMPPGSIPFSNWTLVLHLADAICCFLVLIPLMWSIRALHTAAAADGKARDTLDRLQRFRSFYLYTILYLYTTRVLVFALQQMLSFNNVWLASLIEELATLAYFLYAGYTFRPTSDNPYVRVSVDEGEDGEFGLEDDGVDTAGAGVVTTNRGGRSDATSPEGDIELGEMVAAADEPRSGAAVSGSSANPTELRAAQDAIKAAKD